MLPQLLDFSLNTWLERWTEIVVSPRIADTWLINEWLLGFDREEVGDVDVLLYNQEAICVEKGRVPTFG